MTRPPFPLAIDSTMLSTFRSCPQKMFRTYMQHWKPRGESVHLVAGKAFAAGIETARRAFYEQGLSADDACGAGIQALVEEYGDFECPPESSKSLDRVAGALAFYFDNYPLTNEGNAAIPLHFPGGKRGIEFSFAEPLPVNHPTLNQPLLYSGRADMTATFAGGTYVFDEKTTASLGSSWGRQWEMRSQFTGYCWASRAVGIPVAGVVVRGVSILKTKFDTMEVITYRTEHEVERWLHQTTRDIRRMIALWEEGYWDFSLDHACTEYSGCALVNVCKSKDPDAWLDLYFERKVWDPLLRQETTVEAYEAGMGQ